MADYPKTHKPPETALNTHKTLKLLTAATLGATLLVLSGVVLTAAVFLMVLAGIVTLLVVAGFVPSGGFGVAALSVLTWTYSYATGKHLPGWEQLDHTTKALKHKAKVMKDKARGSMGAKCRTWPKRSHRHRSLSLRRNEVVGGRL